MHGTTGPAANTLGDVGVLLLSVLFLMWLYPQMDELIDQTNRTLLNRDYFRHLHRWYLRVATAQWLGAIVFTVLTLRNWHVASRTP